MNPLFTLGPSIIALVIGIEFDKVSIQVSDYTVGDASLLVIGICFALFVAHFSSSVPFRPKN